MKKNRMLLVLLAAVLFSLSVYLIPVNGPESAVSESFLADEPLDYLMLQKADSFPLYFIRTGDQWNLTLDGSAQYPLNMTRFTAFYDELSRRHVLTDTGIRDHRIHETGERADYRIESGRFGGTITQVAFGTTGADEWFRYISRGPIVYRTDNGIQYFLDTRTAFWVNLRPFESIFEKSGLQRAVLTPDGYHQREVPPDALKGLQRALEGLSCVDITNIPVVPEQELVLELGNLSTIRIGFSRLSAEHAIMSEDIHKVSWIIPAETATRIESFFNVQEGD